MKTTIRKLSAIILVLLMLAGLSACGSSTSDDLWADALYTQDTELGEGSKAVSLTVEAAERTVCFTVYTDADILGDALTDVGLIAGEEAEYGLYIKSVNGITADYDVDGSYWAFYIGGEYAMTGVDMTEINENDAYRLVYEK